MKVKSLGDWVAILLLSWGGRNESLERSSSLGLPQARAPEADVQTQGFGHLGDRVLTRVRLRVLAASSA